MLFLKSLKLVNYCSYVNHTFDFTKPNGEPYRYICFFGPNGVGKCVAGNCYVGTDKGLVPIRDLFDGKQLQPDTWYDANFSVDCNGNSLDVKKIYYNGYGKTVKITTQHGYTLEGSFDRHSILGLKDEIRFVKLSELKKDDIACISRKSCLPNKSTISLEMAGILGYLIAEGSVSSKSWTFHNSDNEVLQNFSDLFFKEFNQKLILGKPRSITNNCRAIYISSKYKKKILDGGLLPVKSGDKTVPFAVMNGSKEIICKFLQC